MASYDWAWLKTVETVPETALSGRFSDRLRTRQAIASALREAEDRARADERALAAGALRLAQAMQAKAVASAVAAERERIKAMLRKPNPRLRHAVAMAKHSQACDDGYSLVGGPAAEAAMFALAAHLSDPQEGE